MFINKVTDAILTYGQLKLLPVFDGVGWPSDPNVSGIDEVIARENYARLVDTPMPSVAAGEIAQRDGFEIVDGVYQVAWVIRNMNAEELAADKEAALHAYEFAIQETLDVAAQAAGYDSINTAVSYADEPAVAKFQSDGQAFRLWRSLVWAFAYEQLAAVESGQRTRPSVEELVLELPTLNLNA